MRKATLLMRALMKDQKTGTTGTIQHVEITFPPDPAPAFPTTLAQERVTPTFQTTPTLAPVQRTCYTMAGVAATEPDPRIPGLLGIFTLLEDGANTTPRSRLKRLATLPMGESPPLVVCLESPEPNICLIWGDQFVTPSFAQPTPEDGKVLAFARDIRLGLLTATLVVHPKWPTSADVAVPQAEEMEALLACLAPRHPCLPRITQEQTGSP